MKYRYIPGLDGLRAIAVLTVFVGHSFPNIVANSVGVDIFFVLSGFLITRGLKDQLEEMGRIDLRSFYKRRIRRLAPALILLVTILLPVATIMKLTVGEHLKPHLLAIPVALTYLMNWVRAFDLGPSGWLGHTWSLAIEEQFYLLWPVLLGAIFKFGRTKRAAWCAGILAFASVAWRLYLLHCGSGEARIYNGFDTRADGLLIGCALALVRPFDAARMVGRLTTIPLLTILLVFVFVPWMNLETLSSTVISLACASLILPLWAGTAPRLAALLEVGPVRYIGRISYGLYLWHLPALMILIGLGFAENGVLTALTAATVSLIAASLSYHLVEKPILDGAYFSYGGPKARTSSSQTESRTLAETSQRRL